MSEDVFDKNSIISSLDAIADYLDEHAAPTSTLIVVGGSFMALRGLRESTADIDTVNRINDSIRAAVEDVARRRGFAADWLNDRATGFAPVGLRERDCEILYEHPPLRVLGPPYDYIFLMKLYAARALDHDDMVALWPRCTFASPEEAARSFASAYPQAPDDPHLGEYIAQIAREAAP